MSSNAPLEIERRFLIQYPDVSLMERMDGYDRTEIKQTYISSEKDGLFGRIRKRGKNGAFKYTLTYKKDITSVTRIELEKEITKQEYEELLKLARKGFATISKQRHCFEFNGLVYEVDIFPFWNDKALMEAEVQSENQEIPIPECINLIKEVTDDERYRNSSLAQQIFSKTE